MLSLHHTDISTAQISIKFEKESDKQDINPLLPHPSRVSDHLSGALVCGQDKSEWRASKLAAKLGMTQEALRSRMAYWLANGVVTDSRASRGEVTYRAAGAVDPDGSAAEVTCNCPCLPTWACFRCLFE